MSTSLMTKDDFNGRLAALKPYVNDNVLELINSSATLRVQLLMYKIDNAVTDLLVFPGAADKGKGEYQLPTYDGTLLIEPGQIRMGTDLVNNPYLLIDTLAHELGHYRVEALDAVVRNARNAAQSQGDKGAYAAACHLSEGYAELEKFKVFEEMVANAPGANQLALDIANSPQYLAYQRLKDAVNEVAATNASWTYGDTDKALAFALGEANKENTTSNTSEKYIDACKKAADAVINSGTSSPASSASTTYTDILLPDGAVIQQQMNSIRNPDGSSSEVIFRTGGGGSSLIYGADGSTFFTSWEPNGRITQTVERRADGFQEITTYGWTGQPTTRTSLYADGTKRSTLYNSFGEEQEVRYRTADGATGVIVRRFDGTTHTEVRAPDGTVYQTYSDPNGTSYAVVRNPDGSILSTTFDAFGNVVSQQATAAGGTTTETTYNADGSVATLTTVDSDQTATTVDGEGKLIYVPAYIVFGPNAKELINPDGSRIRYQYTEGTTILNALQMTFLDGSGSSMVYTLDGRRWLSVITNADGSGVQESFIDNPYRTVLGPGQSPFYDPSKEHYYGPGVVTTNTGDPVTTRVINDPARGVVTLQYDRGILTQVSGQLSAAALANQDYAALDRYVYGRPPLQSGHVFFYGDGQGEDSNWPAGMERNAPVVSYQARYTEDGHISAYGATFANGAHLEQKYTHSGAVTSSILTGMPDGSTVTYKGTPDGAGTQTAVYADGTSMRKTLEASGRAVVSYFDANGNKTKESWLYRNDMGMDIFNADGSRSGTTYYTNNYSTRYTDDGLGNVLTQSVDPSGVVLAETWRKADGTTGTSSVDASGASTGIVESAAGNTYTYSNDGLGQVTYRYVFAGSGNIEIAGLAGAGNTLLFDAGTSASSLSVTAALMADGSAGLLVDLGGGRTVTIAGGLNGAMQQFKFQDSAAAYGTTTLALEQFIATAQAVPVSIATADGTVVFSTTGGQLLQGGSGKDTIYAFGGNNTVVVDDVADVIVAHGSGNTVESSIGYSLAAKGQGVQNLTLTGTADLAGAGNALDNVIRGNAGNNTIEGGGGNDTLFGGAGADTYVLSFGSGASTVVDDGGTVQLSSGLMSSALTAMRQGDDVVLQVIGSQEQMILRGYYTSPQPAWSIRDEAGNVTSIQHVLDATAASPHALAMAEIQGALRLQLRAQLSWQFAQSGYTLQDDGSYVSQLSGQFAPSALQSSGTQFDVEHSITYTDGTTRTYTTQQSWVPLADYMRLSYTAAMVSEARVASSAAVISRPTTLVESHEGAWAPVIWGANGFWTYGTYTQTVNVTDLDGNVIGFDQQTITRPDGLDYLQVFGTVPGATGGDFASLLIHRIQPPATFESPYGSPSIVPVDIVRQEVTSTVEQIFVGDGDHVVYGTRGPFDIKLSVVNAGSGNNVIHDAALVYTGSGNNTIIGANIVYGGSGNNTIEGARTVYGGAGNDYVVYSDVVHGGGGDDRIIGGNYASAGTGDDVLIGGRTMVAGAGYDRIYTSAYQASVEIDPASAGIAVVGGAGNTGNWLGAIYESMGIFDWQDRYQRGGTSSYAVYTGGGYSYFPDAESVLEALRAFGWNVTIEQALDWGLAQFSSVDPLPILYRVADHSLEPSAYYATSSVPVVDVSANSFQELAAHASQAAHTIVFGEGLSATDLQLSWGEVQGSITGLDGERQLKYVTLDLAWGTQGQVVRVIVPHTDDPLGSGITHFTFADGTAMTMADMVAMAPTVPDLDPHLFLYQTGMGVQDVGPGYGGVRFGAGITQGMVTLDAGVILVNGTDAIHMAGFDAQNAAGYTQLSFFRFEDGSSLSYQQLVQRGFDIHGTDGDDTLTGTNLDNRIYGGAGDDTLIASGRSNVLYGGTGSDTLIAGAGTDILVAGTGDTTLIAGTGQSTLVAGTGIDTFLVDVSGPGAVIDESVSLAAVGVGTDVLRVTGSVSSVSATTVAFAVSGNDLRLTVDGRAQIRLKDYLAGAGAPIGSIRFDDGSTWLAESAAAGNYRFGLFGADGARFGTAWGSVDGTTAWEQTYAATGILSGGTTLPNGDSSSYSTFSLGDGRTQTDTDLYRADGSSRHTALIASPDGTWTATWSASDGRTGTDALHADGSTSGSVARPDGTSSQYEVDAAGNRDERHFSYSGTLESLDWMRVDGTHGTISYGVNGATSGTTYSADGSYFAYIGDGLGNYNQMVVSAGNALHIGDAASNTLSGNPGSDLLVGGAGDDTLVLGDGYDIVAINAGDGHDIVLAGAGGSNTLSLGGDFSYADLRFEKAGSDLVLDMGGGTAVTLQDWYINASTPSFATLQVVTDAMSEAAGTHVELFDFQGLVQAFDTARLNGLTQGPWQLIDELLANRVAATDTTALGGDLAYTYGATGTLSGFAVAAAQTVIGDAAFGRPGQALAVVDGSAGTGPRLW